MFRLAIDTGGTFTDCVVQHAGTGALRFWKTLSTPERPDVAVMEGVRAFATVPGFSLAAVDEILIATTVATNAILERAGAPTALVTTQGFRDVLILGRAKRYDTYDLYLDKPQPLVARRHILEIDERMNADGSVRKPLAESSIARLIENLESLDIQSLAVSLLHSYANPAHEREVGARLKAWRPELPVSLSSEVSPKYREYERTSTTVTNAYVTPVVSLFLGRLEEAFRAEGFKGRTHVMQSNGGLLSPELARAFPVNIVESGPAAGVLLGGVIGKQKSLSEILSFDMGGTTAKVGAVEDGEPTITTSFEVDGLNLRQWSGLPLNISAVELIEIGAGGGSIASVDMGIIRVGPASAGAYPGPVCYGRGGDRATITDANLTLGYLDPTRFAGGRLRLDEEPARAAVAAQVAEPLGLSIEEAAWGVHAVANASMERAMRSMSIERGRDPRDFALVAFGGAGPLHACRMARALGIRKVIVPWGAGVGSARGMLEAEPQITVSITRLIGVDKENRHVIAEVLRGLEVQARERVEGLPNIVWRRHAYLRYRGQGYELRVELPPGEPGDDYYRGLQTSFHIAYRRSYGYAQVDAPIEATDWYLTAVVRDDHGRSVGGRAETPPVEQSALDAQSAPVSRATMSHQAYFPEVGGKVDCAIHDRYALAASTLVAGPAIICDDEATTLIPPGDRATVDSYGHMVIDVAED